MRLERHHLAWVLASTTTVACFVGATAYTQARLTRLDALASTLETNAIPSIEYLGRSGVRLTRLNELLAALAADPSSAAVRVEANQELSRLQQDVSRYLALTPLPNERAHWVALRADIGEALRRSRAVFQGDDGEAGSAATGRDSADAALDTAVRSVLATLNSDTIDAEQMAGKVRSVRVATFRSVVALDGGSLIIAALAVIFAFRASRAHDTLLQQHASLLSARVAELDTFAGRVAHDVRNPLGVIAAALSLLGPSCDPPARRHVERSMRAASRVQQLVEDLLTFARSGARPDSSACSSIESVMESLGPDLADGAAQQDIALVCEIAGPLRVRCTPGVLTSIVQNLVRNAVKYMGSRPVKRITVTARVDGSFARMDVADTGPGIPLEFQARIFEPFVRGMHDGIAGSGLGLATVKRLVESHGGHVRCESTVEVGTTIWFELPLAVDRLEVTAGVDEAVTPHVSVG